MTPDWAKLVKDAIRSKDKFEHLERALRPFMVGIASRIASQCVEDAVQEGVLRVWQNLKRVDLKQKSTIRTFLLTAATRGMRDEVRRVIRRKEKPLADGFDAPQESERGATVEFTGLLAEYQRVLLLVETVPEAHAMLASESGISVSAQTKKFVQAAKEYGGVREVGNVTNSIISEILHGVDRGRNAKSGNQTVGRNGVRQTADRKPVLDSRRVPKEKEIVKKGNSGTLRKENKRKSCTNGKTVS